MFKNPGKKLKGLAKVIFWISLIIYVVIGVLIMVGADPAGNGSLDGPAAIVAGVLIIAVGFLVAWLSSIAIYAAGAAVDDIQTIKKVALENSKKNENA